MMGSRPNTHRAGALATIVAGVLMLGILAIPAHASSPSQTNLIGNNWRVFNGEPATNAFWDINRAQSDGNGGVQVPFQRFQSTTTGSFVIYLEDNYNVDLTPQGVRRSRQFRGHEGYVTALAVSADGKRLVTASRDQTIAGWGLEEWTDTHPTLGAVFFPQSKTPLRIGWRFFHISNGVIGERNPGLNVNSIYIGTRIASFK